MTPSQGSYAEMPAEDAHLLFGLLTEKDPALARQLADSTAISEEARKSVALVVAREFKRELDPTYEPTDRGRALDAMLRRFLEKWPIPPD